MNYGIKVSKQGFNVLDINQNPKEVSGKPILPHLLQALAVPYLLGAKKQVRRYQIATLKLNKSSVDGVYECLHEASTLFEDLCTVSKYAEKCGQKNDLHQLWLDVRNHIRHDIREEFDKDSNEYKNKRVQRLKLDPRLQTNIGFNINAIKVGGIRIEIRQINEYLSWAENIMTNILNEAKRKGYIK